MRSCGTQGIDRLFGRMPRHAWGVRQPALNRVLVRWATARADLSATKAWRRAAFENSPGPRPKPANGARPVHILAAAIAIGGVLAACDSRLQWFAACRSCRQQTGQARARHAPATRDRAGSPARRLRTASRRLKNRVMAAMRKLQPRSHARREKHSQLPPAPTGKRAAAPACVGTGQPRRHRHRRDFSPCPSRGTLIAAPMGPGSSMRS
jgi:hypothetical protein